MKIMRLTVVAALFALGCHKDAKPAQMPANEPPPPPAAAPGPVQGPPP